MKILIVLLFAMFPVMAHAEPGLNALSMTVNQDGTETYSLSIQVLVLMTLLTFIPAAILAMTSFVRIVIVLALLRQAIGTMTTPTNQIVIGLALFMTFFVMAPVFDRVHGEAFEPYMNEEISSEVALARAGKPFKRFMLDQVRETDLALFVDMSGTEIDEENLDDVPFSILVPAFLTSELKTAFQIGFMIFIPFLIIDLVVASVLMAMGMMMLSPLIVSLPFKIMMFVLIDGWVLVLGTLASSFYVV
ncbi:MAG TPA: flagellar biosynthesis protein FliP [Candidatus Tenderia electrophaga]|uniref:Flagellar biosynthetic protein FliP n=1 Tax=Candidatus Tenderia electrophaga TaxID=1748243 RepID=A0A832N3E2_9GAMM|nr:flagellar biosynthesis protein FliP [Candidatus Tenderia electrophaga]